MPRSIEGSIAEGGRIVDDAWLTVETADALQLAPEGSPVLVVHALWMSERDWLLARGTPVGVVLEADEDPATLEGDLSHLAMIAIRFPKFTDGRGYSIARLLRERYGYRGSLRAVGDVLRDQLFYMLRCGFDSFVMRHDDHLQDALSAYRDFTEAYQTAVDRTQPLFARRAAPAGASA